MNKYQHQQNPLMLLDYKLMQFNLSSGIQMVILQIMGAECIGKSPRHQHKRNNQNETVSPRSNTTNDNTVQLPPLTIKYHQPSIYPIFSHFNIPSEWQIHRQFRYQDYFQLTSLALNTKLHQKVLSEVKGEHNWGICSDLSRELWEFFGKQTIMINGSSYALSDTKIETTLMTKERTNSKFKFDFLPKSILKLSIVSGQSKMEYFEIKEENQVIGLLSKEMKERKGFQHVKTEFLNGFLCYKEGRQTIQSNFHFTLEFLGASIRSSEFTFFLYPNQTKRIVSCSNVDKKITMRPSTYWQVKMYMKKRGLSLWDCDLSQMLQIIQPKVLKVYCLFQMFRCCLNKLQRQYFENGLYLSQFKDFMETKIKTISNLLMLEEKIMKEVIFMTKLWLLSQRYKDTSKFISEMIQSLAFETEVVADGIFCEFGIEINQKEHPFRNDPFHFLKYKYRESEKHIKIIKKHMLPFDVSLSCYIIQSLQVLCSYGDKLTLQVIQGKNQEVLTLVERHCGKTLKQIQNSNLFGDYVLRIQMIRFFLRLIQGYIDVETWKSNTEQFESLELVTAETAFLYLVLESISHSIKRGTEESTQQEKKSYLKALQIGLKLFGDPRASRQGTEVKKQLIWLLYLIDNYCAIYAHSSQKLEYNFLKNLKYCLKEDLKGTTNTFEYEDFVYNFDILLKQLPIRKFTGWMVKRSEIWDSDKQASRSNYSQYGSSSAIKRLNKSFYKVSQWEFGLKPDMSQGVLLWGHSVPSPPQTVPSLKNRQVLSIATGNYHVVFLTEEGIFGWGENHSAQLGKHNQQKVYKEAVLIESLKINRKTHKFQLNCGNEHTALLINGTLTIWGQEDCGITGGTGYSFDSIACGGLHTLGVKDGKVYSWGRGQGGQLGHPFTQLKQEKREETTVYFLDTPTLIKIEGIVVKAACGDAHSLVLTEDGKVWVFGFSYQGQLGLGLTGESQFFQVFEPTQLLFFKDPVVDIWAGPTSSFFKIYRGDVFSCGYNDCLQLGIDRVLKILHKKKYIHRVVDLNKKKLGEQEFSKPRKLEIFREEMGLRMVRLECGENHCLALAEYQNHEKLLVGWGLNRHFQLDFKISEVTAPRTLDLLHSVEIREFCCGSTFSLAVVGSLPLTFRQASEICDQASNLTQMPQQ